MAFPAYSHRFLLGKLAAGATQTYTVPAGRLAIVQNATWVPDASTGFLSCYITPVGSSSGVQFIGIANPGANVSGLWNGKVVLNAGDVLTALVSVNPGELSVSGVLVTA